MTTFNEYKDNGLSGLANLGNTCFINSCMQILSHTYELDNILNSTTYKAKLNNVFDSIILLEWDELRKMLWSSNCIVSPSKFISCIHKLAKHKKATLFTDYSQNDVAEFLIFIIDCFHLALTRHVTMSIKGTPDSETDELAIQCFQTISQMYSNDYSEIWNMFYGIHVSVLINTSTQDVISKKPEPYFTIDLPIPQNKKILSLLDCMNLYIEGEIIEDVFVETTQSKETVQKKIQFWSFPQILVIVFKRFNSRNQKNQILIDFPVENLDLSKYSVGYSQTTFKYDLYGICNHSGSVFGGHYTSFIKNANGNWYHFNDTNVNRVLETDIITPKAYCLFYRKKTI